MNKLVYGVGLNDADYKIQNFKTENGKRTQTWICPFYSKWKEMLRRCYSIQEKDRNPCYSQAITVDDWHIFSNFKSWMETQDWQGKQLDKDLLIRGNKVYGPKTCIFLEPKVNTFITESTAKRGEWPIGVYRDKLTGKFKSQCWCIESGKRVNLGSFLKAEDAHEAWLNFKFDQAVNLASKQLDSRVADALINRYRNYEINN